MGRFKADMEPPFLEYLSAYYGEHLRKIKGHRNEAFWVRFVYPLVGCAIAGIPSAAAVTAISMLYHGNHEKIADIDNRFAQMLTPENWFLLSQGLIAGAVFIAFIGLFTGILLGMARSTQLLLQAENLELKTRMAWHLSKISHGMERLSSNVTAESFVAPAMEYRPVPRATRAAAVPMEQESDLEEDHPRVA
jgi:hypothetical protein